MMMRMELSQKVSRGLVGMVSSWSDFLLDGPFRKLTDGFLNFKFKLDGLLPSIFSQFESVTQTSLLLFYLIHNNH